MGVKAAHIFTLAAIFALALGLRVAAARHEHIYQWDEAYHALVASNFVRHPLLPVLLEQCPDRYDIGWGQTRVWLHKPPLPLWAIAASLRLFGHHEFFLRLPSILADMALIALIAWAGWTLLSPAAGLVAAFMWAVCPSAIGLVGALCPTDSPDVWLCLWSFLFVALLAKAGSTRRPCLLGFSLGLVLSLAVLSKGITALMLVMLLAGKLACDWRAGWVFDPTPRAELRRRPGLPSGLAFLAGASLFLPWTLYISHCFPIQAAGERAYAFGHIFNIVESHGGGPLFHFGMFASNNFGWPITPGRMAGLLLVGFPVVYGWRGAKPFPRLLGAWVVLVFGSFTIARTKMEFFCYPAYPALFLLGAYWITTSFRPDRIGFTAVVAVFLMAGVWRQLGRDYQRLALDLKAVSFEYDYPAMRSTMRGLNDGAPGIIWNMRGRANIQASYYSGKTALPVVPTAEDIARAKSAGLVNYAVMIENDPADEQLRRKLPPDVTWITLARAQTIGITDYR